MLDRIIRNSFYLLFLVTPLIFIPATSELFEYNKMMFVYILTIVVTTTWIVNMILKQRLILKRSPLDIPIFLFFLSQVISTFLSVDRHTSVWGYYSRSNGGLLSLVSYLLLYYALISNFKTEDAVKFLKAILIGGFLVSLYAIPEHFGVSPSCVLLVQRFAADCWVQDVQTRVFATLGQPNWLGAYLGMIIFPAIYFFIISENLKDKIRYYIFSASYYMALTFTLSRGAALGFLGGLGSFVVLHFGRTKLFSSSERSEPGSSNLLKPLLIILLTFLLINLLFGSALTRFKLFVEAPTPPKPQAAASTQLETGGTESGQIRLIVWKGAMDIFRAYPIFGSGLETFAYTYYNFRPTEHNLVSEWDFLYNKAHNEYLNYLATTGLVGFLTYMGMVLTFLSWGALRIFNFQFSIFNKNFKLFANANFASKNQISNFKDTFSDKLFIISILAGYVSYLVQNFFGFSVVMVALLFYIYPGFVFLKTNSLNEVTSISLLSFLTSPIKNTIYKRILYKRLVIITICLIGLMLIMTLYRYWSADTYYKNGSSYSDAGNPGQAYNFLIQAVNLNPTEPLYRIELGYAAGSAALALSQEDASKSSELEEQAQQQTSFALSNSPANISLWRTAIRTYFELSFLDPKYEQKTLEVVDRAITLAPTDPKLLFNKALILDEFNKTEEALEVLKKAIELKPNYKDAYISLGDYYLKLNKKEAAKAQYETVLKLTPNDEEVISKLNDL
ncbi:MAG: hypothetical protein ACD_30C00037G0008 [uncultured bacterium]|uniref:O-antigen ligase-related domain-containing protein n=3 Tax=Candidatus Daviesiibacteriota TaxID=1752718 RepID=A0A0G0F6J8_9BACT|nr:MAG: hypothetical protein ACD_30C00037G0008 [uncultured bacterium]KKQ09095.1 MAG: hypothetical protein US19_C0017G0040 [Candidatus Daviesbacteria bacterium GW2011_GWB1_36_5]KKQ16129.1 MAG: hypothetical protein US28_C0005G0044 [Candidatus Daviesbacteria bacterium GW2011_GWA1_36_8]OGE36418.1 MAG: hypothetical protein A3E66_04490 [Candidatus Daviesbacteria bacterium RIFCSPHIGHO2_12_FULL_37_16]